jgi:hypothetical protein
MRPKRRFLCRGCLRLTLLWSIGVALGSIYSLHRVVESNEEVIHNNSHSVDVTEVTSLLVNSNTKNVTTTAPYAYIFLLAGCDPNNPSYRGFLFNILISTELLLKEFQSQAHVVVLVRLAPDTNHTRLAPVEESWLHAVGARIRYLPPPRERETFQEIQLLKFHVLELVQYQRVLYLDSDVMPVCNLDYIFQLSVQGVLRENMVVAWTQEPANGGFFLLTPKEGAYAFLLQIVQRQKETSQYLPLPHFDKIQGWGHAIGPNDQWHSFQRRQSGHKWSFYAAWSDQGLLYHYVKYVQRTVSIVLGKTVHNFKPGPNGTVVLAEELNDPFGSYTCRRTPRGGLKKQPYLQHPAHGNNLGMQPPYSDFIHFYSVFKPWAGEEGTLEADVSHKHQAQNVRQYWFYLLRRLNERLAMGIPLHDEDAWRHYATAFQQAPRMDNRVPSLRDLALQNRSIHSYY